MKKKKPFLWVAGAVVAIGVIGGYVGGSEDVAERGNGFTETEPPIVSYEPAESTFIVEQPKPTPSQEEPSSEVTPESTSEEPSPAITEPAEAPVPSVDPEQAFRDSLMQYNYVGSSESDKYHKPTCRWTDEINDSNLVHFDTIEEAKAAGYEACGTCRPK